MKKALIIIIVLSSISVFAQPIWLRNKDSIINSINFHQKNDTVKVMMLVNYCKEKRFCEALENIKIADQALTMAVNLHFVKGIALAYLYKGYYYHVLGNNDSAEVNFSSSLKIAEKINNKRFQVDALNGLCWCLKFDLDKRKEIAFRSIELAKSIGYEQGSIQTYITLFFLYFSNDINRSVDYAMKFYKLADKYNDIFGIFWYYRCMGTIFNDQKSYPKAEEFGLKALKIIENYNDCGLFIEAYNILGEIYKNWDKNEKALDFYSKALEIAETAGDKNYLRILYNNRAEIYLKINKPDASLADLIKGKNLGEYNSFNFNYNIGEIYFKKKKYTVATRYLELAKDSCLINFKIDVNAQTYLIPILETLAKSYDSVGNFKKSSEILWLISSEKDSIFNSEKSTYTIELIEKNKSDKKEKEYQILKQKNKIKDMEISRRNILAIALSSGVLALIFIILFIFRERKKSEKLLLNILPKNIARRLKKGETTIADHFDDASVIFIDIVEFTKTSSGTSAKRVAEVLNTLYSKLDHIAKKNGLEKIKTIGDCYMAAAGIPIADPDNAVKAAKFALEAMQILKDYDTGDGTILQFRCGVDCGPVVAGVIGEHKFIYDVWGDTVNTAARMEEYCEPGKIQVTERFKNALNHPMTGSHWMTYEERGEIEIKGKGLMKTCFLINNIS